MIRKDPLVTGEVYHVMNKSIAGYQIYREPRDYERMLQLIRFFSMKEQPGKFSQFCDRVDTTKKPLEKHIWGIRDRVGIQVQIVSYCLMPTHFHIQLRQLDENAISNFLHKTLNAYARYFNTKYKRKGPLFVGRFKNVLVENDEQNLHVSRYINLNPVSAGLVDIAKDWAYSSYGEYTNPKATKIPISVGVNWTGMSEDEYGEWCSDQELYQRELAVIQKQVLE